MKNWRVVIDSVLVINLLIFSWPVFIAFTLIGLIALDFFEVLIFGYALDLLYHPAGGFLLRHAFLISAIVSYMAFSIIKKYLRIEHA